MGIGPRSLHSGATAARRARSAWQKSAACRHHTLRESAAFRRLWAGTTLSSAGSALASFAVVLQVYDLTRSPVAVGMLGVAQMVPTLAVGLLGGPVTDVMDRRSSCWPPAALWPRCQPRADQGLRSTELIGVKLSSEYVYSACHLHVPPPL